MLPHEPSAASGLQSFHIRGGEVDLAAGNRGKTILVVEDDSALRTFYRSALMFGGFRVLTAPDGVEALRQIEGDAPDLVVLDMDLPQLGGRDVLAEVKSHTETRRIPVMVVSGVDTRDLHDAARVMRKPITAEEFIAAVDSLLAAGVDGGSAGRSAGVKAPATDTRSHPQRPR